MAAQVLAPSVPDIGPLPAPQTAFEPAFLARAEAYRTPLYVVGAVAIVVRVAVAAAIALTSRGRALAAAVVIRVGRHRPARAAAAVITATIVATDLLLFPLSFWAGFVHDGAYGLRTQGLAGWLYDWTVLAVPVWLGVAAIACIGYWLARRAPRLWPALAGLAAALAGAVVIFLSPLVLEPLLYRFSPLPPGPVRTEVEQVLARANEDVAEIVVADASRRSTRQNAYISGFGASERVVLYDTLLAGRPPAEVGLVLAHELTHKRNADVARYTLLVGAGSVLAAYAVAVVVRRRAQGGQQADQADPTGAAAVLLTVVVLSVLAMPVQSWFSRRTEAAADLGSLQFTDAPEVFTRMHVGLAQSNLAQPQPPGVVSWYWGTHPPTMARLAMARWWEQQ